MSTEPNTDESGDSGQGLIQVYPPVSGNSSSSQAKDSARSTLIYISAVRFPAGRNARVTDLLPAKLAEKVGHGTHAYAFNCQFPDDFEGQVWKGLQSIARGLVQALTHDTVTTKLVGPLWFVSHGVGGIVLIAAIALIRGRSETARARQLLNQIGGMIFINTPFPSSENGDDWGGLSQLLKMYHPRSEESQLEGDDKRDITTTCNKFLAFKPDRVSLWSTCQNRRFPELVKISSPLGPAAETSTMHDTETPGRDNHRSGCKYRLEDLIAVQQGNLSMKQLADLIRPRSEQT